VYYPIIKKIADFIGLKLTKERCAKGLSKVIPMVGGIVPWIPYVFYNETYEEKTGRNVIRNPGHDRSILIK
jgi:hypothetical protein